MYQYIDTKWRWTVGFVEVIFLLGFVTVLVVVLRVVRYDIDEDVRTWSAAYGLRITPGNTRFVRTYLRTGRRLRFVCSVAGLLLPPLVGLALDPQASAGPSLNGLIAGYMVGSLWAALSLTRTGPSTTRVAALSPRRLPDYLPARLRWALRAIGLSTTVLAIAALSVEPRDTHITGPSSTTLLLAVTGVALAIAVEAAQRWILRRPQPFVAPDLVAADDAVRSSSIHALAGSGIASLLLLQIGPAIALAGSDTQALRWVMPWVALTSFLGALVAIRYYVYRAWRVRRTVPTVAVTA
jgi:hypothetical protein